MCRLVGSIFPYSLIAVVLSIQGCNTTNSDVPNWDSMKSNGFQTDLYFGGVFRDPSAWTNFLRETVTPRFPGFTVLSGEGNWKDRVGLPTKILRIVHSEKDAGKIEEIRKIFIDKFHHQSVMRVSIPVNYEF